MIKGVDLSTFQKDVDYQALKRDGVEFAILRIGYGKDASQKDAMFEEHYKGCKDAGIKIGIYHYSYCTSNENAEKEAINCLNYLEGRQIDLPIFYDVEDKKILDSGVDPTTISKIFCNKIKEAGYKSGVYASLSWFRNYFEVYDLINDDIKIWVAQWGVSEPTAEFPYDYWQFTNSLEVGNICCDGDYTEEFELYPEENNNNVNPDDIVIDVNVCKCLAVDCIYGKYGNGDERKQNLGNYYEETQNIINDMYEIIKGE